MNDNNLIPNTRRSPEELREMGRKGGIASGIARRRRCSLLKTFKLFMQVVDDLEQQDPEISEKFYRELIKRTIK